jgi:hypothetical protein
VHALALALTIVASQAAEDPIEVLDRARVAGELDPAGLRDNWVDRARLLAERGDPEGAERALAIALRIDRDLVLDEALLLLGPMLESARAGLPEEGRALSVELEKTDAGVRARLVADDLGLVRGAEVELAESQVVPAKLSVDAPEAELLVTGPVPDEVAVYLLDEHGNVLGGRRVNLLKPEAAPEKVTPASPDDGPELSGLAVAGSSLAITGALVLAGCAAGTVVVASGPPEDREPMTTVFVAGALVGAAVGAIGIGLAATDRVMNGGAS